MNPRPLTLGAAAAVAIALPSLAQTTCGFEPPAYHAGALAAQAAWSVWPAGSPASFAQVVTNPRRAGTQAARISQQDLNGDTVLTWNVSTTLTPGQTALDVEWDTYILIGAGYGWTLDLRATNNVRLGMLWIDGGNLWYRVWSRDPLAADGFLNPGQWGHFKITMDWAARTTDFYLNGDHIASSTWTGAPARGLGSFEIATVSTPGFTTDVLGLDSILVTPRGVCHADFNADGFVDFFDYDDFVSCFETGICPLDADPDFNRDGFVDFFDYGDFVATFETGC